MVKQEELEQPGADLADRIHGAVWDQVVRQYRQALDDLMVDAGQCAPAIGVHRWCEHESRPGFFPAGRPSGHPALSFIPLPAITDRHGL